MKFEFCSVANLLTTCVLYRACKTTKTSFTLQDYDGPRVFLSSMTAIDLGSNAWKNMTTFASSGDSGSRNSTNATVPPILRADSTLTYVPNLGTDNKGVLVAIGVRLLTYLYVVYCAEATMAGR